MAHLWRWEARAAAWDAELDAQLEKGIASERKSSSWPTVTPHILVTG
jgi:hypothetical protein